jgi:hypothetical protein
VVEEPSEPEDSAESEPDAPSDGMLSQDEIAALFDAEESTSPDEDTEPEIQEDTSTDSEIEELNASIDATEIEEVDSEAVELEETTNDAETDSDEESESDGTLSQDEIAALFDAEEGASTGEEIPSADASKEADSEIQEEKAPEPEETEAVDEATESEEITEPDQAEVEDISEAVEDSEETVADTSETAEPADDTAPDSESDYDENRPESEKIGLGMDELKPGDTELETPDESDSVSEKMNKTNIFSLFMRILKKPFSRKKQLSKEVNSEVQESEPDVSDQSEEILDQAADIVEEAEEAPQVEPAPPIDDASLDELESYAEDILEKPAEPEPKKKKKKKKKEKKSKEKKSGLKSVLAVLGILILMTGAFAGGFFVRDYVDLPEPDPAQVEAEAEAKAAAEAKREADEKRAAELAEISPSEYTSSMYLDSIILKGRAEKTTSVKLQRIDDVSRLVEFPNLRRIRIYDMTGDEDLSVIQELSGVEEITIESSIIKNQFGAGSIDTVTYIELFDCTVENTSQFASFEGLTDLYVFFSDFVSEDGNLDITAHLPALKTLTLSNCGEYEALVGVQDLENLKTLNISSKTLVKNMSYIENPNIESLKVDVSFAEDIEQLKQFADLEQIKSLTIQVKKNIFSLSQLNGIIRSVNRTHPDANVRLSTY